MKGAEQKCSSICRFFSLVDIRIANVKWLERHRSREHKSHIEKSKRERKEKKMNSTQVTLFNRDYSRAGVERTIIALISGLKRVNELTTHTKSLSVVIKYYVYDITIYK